jgi:hypothetical protein
LPEKLKITYVNIVPIPFVPIKEQIEQYSRVHGPERVQGYIDALTVFKQELEEILYAPRDGDLWLKSAYCVHRDLKKYFNDKEDFFKNQSNQSSWICRRFSTVR